MGAIFDPKTGELSKASLADKVLLLDGQAAQALEKGLEGAPFSVTTVQKKPLTQRPYPPFITSTLQQEAGRKLNYTAQRTMRVAQRLYESGYITYMRTDSTTLSSEAINAARQAIAKMYGDEYLPEQPRTYKKKVKGAQEAHEAIRPAGHAFRTIDELRSELDQESFRLYELIWKRTVASQMKDALGERTQIRLRVDLSDELRQQAGSDVGDHAIFGASGKVIKFAGYLRAYVRGTDDPEADLDDKEKLLPPLNEGDQLDAKRLEAREHHTQPPARYTEASLVKELEERGIGRPSTYATIIQTIQDRGYAWKQGGALVPTLTAFAVVNLLEQHFGDLVDYEFTARMEGDLDAISNGERKATPWLELFYYGGGDAGNDNASAATETTGDLRRNLADAGLKGLIGSGVEDIDARGICSLPIGETPEGEPIAARVGRYGPYLQVADTDRRANIADDVVLDALDVTEAMRLISQADRANRSLGVDPETGKEIYIKTGGYGPYVQLGEPELTPKGNIKKGGKPRTASLWPSMSVDTITLEQAQQLLTFPKVLGKHPETDAEITVQDGKFGPYLQMINSEGKRDSRSLENHEQMAAMDLAGALKIFAEPRKKGRRQASNSVLAELAVSPATEKPIQVRTGRFGPYVTDGVVNATIPASRDPQKVTFDDALELIAAREQRLREQGVDPRAPKKGRKAAGTKRAAAKSAKTPKKAAAKKVKKAKKAKKPSAKKAKKSATK